MEVLVNFIIKSYDAGLCGDMEPIVTKLSEYYDGNIKFNELVEMLMEKYMLKTKENIKEYSCYILGLDSVLWSDYFSFSNGFYPEKTYYLNPLLLKIELWKLNKQFNLSNKTFELSICGPGVGGEVGNCVGIKFFFHTNEKDIHNKPHIHCKYSGEEIRIDLETLTIMDKPFKNKAKNKKVLEVIKLNQEGLINYWNKVVVNGEYMKFKMTYLYTDKI